MTGYTLILRQNPHADAGISDFDNMSWKISIFNDVFDTAGKH